MHTQTVVLLCTNEEDREAITHILETEALGLKVNPVRSALKCRETLLATSAGALVIELGGVAELKPGVVLRTLFSGSGYQLAREVPTVLMLPEPSREDVTATLAAVAQAKLKRFDLIVRADMDESLPRAMHKIFGARRPSSNSDAPAAPSPRQTYAALIDSLKAGSLPMPGVPTAILKIREMVDAGATTSDALAEVVELDPTVTAMVLRLAGSASYRSTRRVRNVREAIMRVGALQVARLAETALARGCFVSKNRAIGKRMDEAWAHALARALTVRHAARFEGPDQQERQFLQAMLADVGSAFLLNAVVDLNPSALEDEELFPFIRQHHHIVGAALLACWRAPAECVQLARTHHERIESDPMSRRLHFATRAAIGLGYPTPFEDVAPITLEQAGPELNVLDDADAERIRHDVRAHLADAAATNLRAA